MKLQLLCFLVFDLCLALIKFKMCETFSSIIALNIFIMTIVNFQSFNSKKFIQPLPSHLSFKMRKWYWAKCGSKCERAPTHDDVNCPLEPKITCRVCIDNHTLRIGISNTYAMQVTGTLFKWLIVNTSLDTIGQRIP